MKLVTKNKLLMAWQYCDDHDKSTEFMIEYMMDYANVSFDCVMNFIEKTPYRVREAFLKKHTIKP